MAIKEFFELETVHFDVSSCPITTIFWGGWWFEGFGLNKTTWKEKKYCWNSSPEQPSIRDKKGRQLLLTLSSVPRFAPAFCPYLLCTALSTSRLQRFGHFPSAAFEWYSPRTKSKTIKQRRPCWLAVYFYKFLSLLILKSYHGFLQSWYQVVQVC